MSEEEFSELIKTRRAKKKFQKRYIVFDSSELPKLAKLIALALKINENEVDLSPIALRNTFIALLLEKAQKS